MEAGSVFDVSYIFLIWTMDIERNFSHNDMRPLSQPLEPYFNKLRNKEKGNLIKDTKTGSFYLRF
jgi:hypothetical protein